MNKATILRLAAELNDAGRLGFDHTGVIEHAQGDKNALQYLRSCVEGIVASYQGTEWEGPCHGDGQGDFGVIVNGRPQRVG